MLGVFLRSWHGISSEISLHLSGYKLSDKTERLPVEQFQKSSVLKRHFRLGQDEVHLVLRGGRTMWYKVGYLGENKESSC